MGIKRCGVPLFLLSCESCGYRGLTESQSRPGAAPKLIQKCLRTAENNPTSTPLPLMKPHSSSKAELSSSSCITREDSKNPEVSSFLESPAGSAKQGQDRWV